MTPTSIVPTIDELFVDTRSLPSPPVSVLEILRRSDDPDVSMAEIASLIEADVGIAVQVLRLSNSALYSLGREITTVNRALLALGLRTVKLIALTTSLRSLVPQNSDAIDLSELRHRMAVTSGVARRGAELWDRSACEEAFVAGLLTGVGPIVLASQAPSAARLLFHGDSSWPSLDRQRSALGYTFDDISAELLGHWGLPGVFAESIRSRHETSGHAGPVASALALATAAVPILTGQGDQTSVATLRGLIDGAGAADVDADEWFVGCEEVVTATAASLQFRIPHEVAYADLLADASERLITLQLGMETTFLGDEMAADELARRNDELEAEASTDALTGLPNRRAFDRALDAFIERKNPAVGLLLLDLDEFKQVNDTHGHAIGDDVLRAVGSALRKHTRGDDFTARFGGEEFTMLIPSTDSERLGLIAERLRAAIAAIEVPLPDGTTLSVTASVGGALVGSSMEISTARDLIEAADDQLYAAKRGGRDRASLA